MKIGVVSDTHNNLRNVGRIVELFNDYGVERVIHTGDITQAKTLDVFAQLRAPLWGVYGNNDQERESLDNAVANHGFNFSDPPCELVWHRRRIVVVHDPLEFDGVLNNDHELALHGHTHLHRYEQRGSQVIFNPGECAGHMVGFNAIGVLDLSDLSAELLRF
ncbi:MAG: YfcE family phosphodiesterase [Gammaproteobacteria bacterium]|nr:YfcE family phosphodiesterase [Gammaproteobacteria bacterium]